MKHTKKRALLSAIAMLVVSAVVLSSATFAWFMAGTTATVTGIATTVKSGSSVQVSSTGTEGSFSNTIDRATLDLESTNFIPGELTAVSTGSSIADNTFFSGTLLNSYAFSASAATLTKTGPLVKFTVYVRCSTPGLVTLTSTTISGGAQSMVYTAARIDNSVPTTKLYAGDGGTSGYAGITSAGTGTDSNHNSYMDGSDSPAYSGTLQNVTPLTGGLAAFTIPFTGAVDETHTLTVWMWLEGQDPQCAGTVSATPSLAIQFNAPA